MVLDQLGAVASTTLIDELAHRYGTCVSRLHPRGGRVGGRGNVMKFPRSALARAELARRLRDEGWTLDAIAKYLNGRKWDGEGPAGEAPNAGPDEAEPSPEE